MNFSLFAHAARYFGTKEVKGRKSNPLILRWLRLVLPRAKRDETPWCSAFLYACAMEVGAERPPRDKAPAAASWEKVGEEVQATNWALGDVVVIRTKPGSWQRHVGLFVNTEGDYVRLLGGNQSNGVTIAKYKLADVTAVRRLRPSVYGTLGECSESVTD